MAGKKQLEPVDLSTPRGEMSLSEAIASGTRLDELRAQRRILVTHIENEEALTRDIPPLMRQLREISKEIETLEIQDAEDQQGRAGDGVSGPRSEVWKLEAI